jgi:hypothetical protein
LSYGSGRKDGPSCSRKHTEPLVLQFRALYSEDGVGEFEEGVVPVVETFVERATERLESIERFYDATIMHSPTTFRITYLPAGLKRTLQHHLRSLSASRGGLSLPMPQQRVTTGSATQFGAGIWLPSTLHRKGVA